MPQSSSVPVTPQYPLVPAASSALLKLSKLVAKITAEDINGAKLCGGGGFGDVYVLTHPAIGKLALKRVRTSGNHQQIAVQLRRSTREAETWRQLTHPNVLPFLDVLERSGVIYLVSPFVQNGSLSDFVRRNPDADRARLIQEAAAGIAYLHRSGIVHGDVKGANILVSDDIRALLCDFGLARPEQINTSTDVQGMGTVRWQSPELLLSGAGKSYKSDIWAFAMTIFEVLSGHIPYHQYDTITAVIIAVIVSKQRPIQEPATSSSGVSYAPLWEVATACWHEDPDQRPEMQDAHDRLILGGFRSLQLFSSPISDENTPNDDQVIPTSSIRSPSPSLLGAIPSTQSTQNQATHEKALATQAQRERPEKSPETAKTAVDNGEQTMRAHISQGNSYESLWDSLVVTEGPLLEGHSDSVRCLAFTPDSSIVVSGSDDNTLQLWDANSGREIGEPLEGHTDSIKGVAFSPDGRTVVSGSDDNTLRLWDVVSGERLGGSLRGHTKSVECLAFSPDGRFIVSGSFDESLRLWDVETGRLRRGGLLRGHTNSVETLAFSADGKIIVSGSYDHTLRLWDVKSGRQKGKALRGHTDAVNCLVISSDSKTIASGSSDHTLRIWDVESGHQRGATLEGHTGSVYCLALLPNGTTMVSGSGDKTLRFWDVASGSQRGEASEGHADGVFCLAVSPDGRLVASGSDDFTVRLWDTESGHQIGQPLESHVGGVMCVAFSPDGTTLASGSVDNTVQLWTLNT